LNGRKHKAGSVTRISAPEIERLVETALSEHFEAPTEEMFDRVDKVIVSIGRIRITLKQAKGRRRSIDLPWTPKPKIIVEVRNAESEASIPIDQKLLKSLVRAHAWLDDLSRGRRASIEDLAAANTLHPKVIRQGLRLAFLTPDLTRNVIDGGAPVRLSQIPKLLPLSWTEQRRSLG
jgi:site-specific DNA recombinase